MKVCLISYFFPPNNSSGSQRWSKLVKCLHRSGYDVCVIANVGDSFGGEDPERGVEMNGYARVYRIFHRVPHRPPLMAESLLKEALKFFVVPDSRLPFFVRNLRRIERIVEMERPDVLIATAPPFSALLLARFLSVRTGVPFVADLRDPWLNDPQRPNRWAKYLLERWALSGARAVMVVNDREIYREAERFNRRVFLLEHAYDPEDYALEPVPHPGEVWVSHIGSLFSEPQRKLLEGVRRALPDGFRLRLFGPGADRVLNRREAFREMVSADVLLVVILSRRKENRASSVKFYDYLGAGKPIVVVSENPFLIGRAKMLGLEVAPPGVEEVVGAVVRAHRKNRTPNRKRYEYRLDVACCKLKGILGSVL